MAAKPSPSKIDAILTSVKKESTDRLVTELSNYKPVDYPLERARSIPREPLVTIYASI